MKIYKRIFVAVVLVLTCMLIISASPAQAEEPSVGTFGVIFRIQGNGKTLFLEQEGFEIKTNPKFETKYFEQQLAIGHPGNKLVVHIDKDTKVYLGGEEVSISDEFIGLRVIVTGRQVGSSLHAEFISDLAELGPPPEDLSLPIVDGDDGPMTFPPMWGSTLAETISLCMGQAMDFTSDYIKVFQGCWGGPSAQDDINLPDIPVLCPLIGCFMIDRFAYNVGLAGWGFALPFEFSVPDSDLVYHVPSPVTLDVQPVAPTPYDSSFWGGLGIDAGINIDWCDFITGCSDLGTIWTGLIPSSLYGSDDAPPFPGEVWDIDETSCPGIGIIAIPETPIDLLSIHVCQNMEFTGVPFYTTLKATNTDPEFQQSYSFEGSPRTITIRPDALSVGIDFNNFQYIPTLNIGLYFSVKLFNGNVTLFDTPTIHLASGPFPAITTPFPLSGSLMSVATDPLSPIGDIQYLYQPTLVQFNLAVQPAPTRLTILSPTTVVEGDPIEVLLQEDYDGSPIAGVEVTFDFGDSTTTAVTNAEGIAQVFMPPGEYYLTASFAGNPYYLPSSDTAGPIYVFRPTTFVIWGGNPDGIQYETSYNFWGSDWWKQVTGGDFFGDASFKGNAIILSEDTWTNPPASAGILPETLPSHIGVIVTTHTELHGTNMVGNIAYWVVLEVIDYEGYKPNLGFSGWGIMKAVVGE